MNTDRASTVTNSQLKKGYKQTEVGIIPEDWEAFPISHFASVSSGGTPSRKIATYWGGGIPWITTTQIDFNVINSCNEFITEEGLKNSAAKIYNPGTLLMAMYGQGKTRGKVAITGITATVNQACAAISLSNSVSRSFVFHNLASRYQEIRELSNTGNQENLNGNLIKNILVALPPTLPEQQAIACTLSDIDALIESLDRLLTKKRQIKQGAMQELLLSKDGRTEKRLGDLANILRGASPRPIDSPVWFDENSEIGWVRISDITKSGIFLYTTTQRLSPLGVKSSRFVARNNLIMSICATVGRPIITAIDTCIHDGFVVFEDLQADMRFVFYALQSIEDDWGKHGQTGSQMNLNTNLINSTKIFIPESREEQIEIANILSDMDAEIESISAKLTKTRQLKQGMMYELLTGRIRLVKNANHD
jgi:type I restriction enzyme, S subunit